MSLLSIFFPTNEKTVANYSETVKKINDLEKKFESFSQEELITKTKELRLSVENNATLSDLTPEAFALVREAAKPPSFPIRSVLASRRSRHRTPRCAARCFFHMTIRCGKSIS